MPTDRALVTVSAIRSHAPVLRFAQYRRCCIVVVLGLRCRFTTTGVALCTTATPGDDETALPYLLLGTSLYELQQVRAFMLLVIVHQMRADRR